MAFLAMARYLAAKSEARMRHGAVLVRGGSVIGTGFNKAVNHPRIVSSEHIRTHCSRHAEIEAMRDANYNVRKATLYVARVNVRDVPRNSMPCLACAAAIRKYDIKRVVYTVDETRIGTWRNDVIRLFSKEQNASQYA